VLAATVCQIANEISKSNHGPVYALHRPLIIKAIYEVLLPELARVLQQRSEFLKTFARRATTTSQLHAHDAMLRWDASGTKTLQVHVSRHSIVNGHDKYAEWDKICQHTGLSYYTT
jgi:hypothetical protein